MAAPAHLIQLDDPEILVCNLCRTHLALAINVFWTSAPDVFEPYIMIIHMVNIDFGENHIEGDYVRTPVACRNCSLLLGCRYVPAHLMGEHTIVGRFAVNTRRLLLLTGNVLRDAHSRLPIFGHWRVPIVRFYRPPGNVYQCSQCQTHIAQEHFMINRAHEHGIFSFALNIHMGLTVDLNNHRRAPVYCNACYRELGLIIVTIVPPNGSLGNGIIVLNMRNIRT